VLGNPHVLALERLCKAFSMNTTDMATRNELHQMCRAIIRRMLAWKVSPLVKESQQEVLPPFEEDVLETIIKTSLGLDDKLLFLDAYPLCSGHVYSTMFIRVGAALIRWNLHSVLPK
jgi:hypothetical protein